MKMNELKLIYFSPTGTTHKVVMETARSIDLKSVSFDLTIKKDLKPVAKFAPNDFALFAIPVYYGRVPALFLKYLDLFSGNGTPAALVATYGCREYEDALLELKTEVEKRGFKVIGAAAFPAEHSIVNSIGARRPNKADLKEASEYGISLNRIIKKRRFFRFFRSESTGKYSLQKIRKKRTFSESRRFPLYRMQRLRKDLSGRSNLS